MRPTQLFESLVALIPARRPVMVWGPPGVGKSMVTTQACDALELQIKDVRAGLMDPVDINGLPSVKNGRVTWCPPDFWPLAGKNNGKGVIFLDELPQAPPATQAALLQAVLDHRIGQHELDPNWTFIAAGNRQEDRAGANRMITPLLNRFIHLEMEVSVDDWNAWAVKAGIAPEVRSFIRFRPSHLHQFDPSGGAKAFPTPRSWHFASDILGRVPQHLRHPAIAGCVGEGNAAEFCTFVRLYEELPDIEEAVNNPDKAKIPTKADILHAFCGAVAEKIRGDVSQERVDNVIALSLRIEQDEFSLYLARDVVALQLEKFKVSKQAKVLFKRHRANLTDQAGK